MSIVGGVLSFTDAMSPVKLAAFAQRLEALGHRSLWLPDLLGRELFVTAGFVLSRTTRLEVGTGIAKRSFGPGASRPIIRGFDGDRVLVMQDGIRTGSLSSQSGDHGELINPAQLEPLDQTGRLLFGEAGAQRESRGDLEKARTQVGRLERVQHLQAE